VEYLKDKEFISEFGKNLRKVRKSKGYTQEELANDIGVEISQISRIERGVINTSISTVNVLAKALKIEVSELFKFDS
jgi:transcriptional regulator with XRE-family HTH domain